MDEQTRARLVTEAKAAQERKQEEAPNVPKTKRQQFEEAKQRDVARLSARIFGRKK